jgi:hypothetical protein
MESYDLHLDPISHLRKRRFAVNSPRAEDEDPLVLFVEGTVALALASPFQLPATGW